MSLLGGGSQRKEREKKKRKSGQKGTEKGRNKKRNNKRQKTRWKKKRTLTTKGHIKQHEQALNRDTRDSQCPPTCQKGCQAIDRAECLFVLGPSAAELRFGGRWTRRDEKREEGREERRERGGWIAS